MVAGLTRPESLKFTLNPLVSCDRGQTIVDPLVDTVRDEPDVSVRKNKLGPTNMVAAEVVEMTIGVVRRVISGTKDSLKRLLAARYPAYPS